MSNRFTLGDVASAAALCGLSSAEEEELLVQVNKLDEHVSLDLLNQYAEFMTKASGENFVPRIDSCEIPAGRLWYIEPFCGSTTYVLETAERLVVVDSGFPCYAEELKKTLRSLFPDYDSRQKDQILTHMDMDHAGILDGFENIWMSKTSFEDFLGRAKGKPNLRERHPVRTPVYRISSLLSRDISADTTHMRSINTFDPEEGRPLSYIGTLNIEPFSFAVYETSGGHVAGSILLYEKENRLVFTGDTLVNPADMGDGQKAFIALGTAMLGSMNADSAKAKAERAEMFALLDAGGWILCPGHGFPMRYTV
ncbi:MAG: MBL fold metallo-hydrolase [Methanocorpusculum sp.]|nr:MBL fold metallo-hydrolase [Methanocorpusculum sp.]